MAVIAAIAAVSVRKIRGPNLIVINPSEESVSISAALKPPSGPIKIDIASAFSTVCSLKPFFASGWSSQRCVLEKICSLLNSLMLVNSCSVGKVLRPHCSQALLITPRQCL